MKLHEEDRAKGPFAQVGLSSCFPAMVAFSAVDPTTRSTPRTSTSSLGTQSVVEATSLPSERNRQRCHDLKVQDTQKLDHSIPESLATP